MAAQGGWLASTSPKCHPIVYCHPQLLFGQFGYAVEAFAKVCTTLPGVDYTYPTQSCDRTGCTGASGEAAGTIAGKVHSPALRGWRRVE